MAPKDEVHEVQMTEVELDNSISQSFKPTTKEDTVIFFDWDDTLLASTYVAKLGLRPRYSNQTPLIPDDVKERLQILEESVLELLHLAMKFGQVVIVTAAEAGWVELSAALFLPRTLDLIETKIKVVSARTNYEAIYPTSPKMWKMLAFRQEVYNHFGEQEQENHINTFRHLLSFGDSTSEREAAISIAEHENFLYGKSMKFLTRPSIEELKQQIDLILGCFDSLCTYDGHFDLQLSKEMIQE